MAWLASVIVLGLVSACQTMGSGSGVPGMNRDPGEPSTVQGGPFRLYARAFRNEKTSDMPVLVVVIHGDAPLNPPEYHYVFAAIVAETFTDVVAVGLLRPGYVDPQGNTSEGERGEAVGDSFHATNTDAIAEAIAELKKRWNARRVVVATHSGGGVLTANVLGRHPDLVDGALLVSSIYDVPAWRAHMFERTGKPIFQGNIETLSPIEGVAGISDQLDIVLMVGSDDEIAPPRFSEQFDKAAREHGKKVKLIVLEGEGHETFIRKAVGDALGEMLK